LILVYRRISIHLIFLYGFLGLKEYEEEEGREGERLNGTEVREGNSYALWCLVGRCGEKVF